MKPKFRKEMLWVSAFTSLAGLTEPLFVPSYWTPPSLFDLAINTHFDIESFLFTFSIGGVGSVLYESILNLNHQTKLTKFSKRRWPHFFSLTIPSGVFLILFFFTNLNPIYSASAALFIGALATIVCRPDLIKNTFLGGILFMSLYFIIFVLMTLIFPDFVDSWNIAALSGILIFGVPLEEFMFSFTFGMFWSGVYEHIKQYILR